MNIHVIWAQDNNGGIGKNNSLPWHISEDLINFKKITSNNTIIMGRKTWDSLPIKPLPNRRNIVLTSNDINNIETYSTIDSCLKNLKDDGIIDIFVIGGEQIYNSFYDYADILHITFIDQIVNGIDTYFPISIKEIKKVYKMVEKIDLAKHCTYTKWIKQSNLE